MDMWPRTQPTNQSPKVRNWRKELMQAVAFILFVFIVLPFLAFPLAFYLKSPKVNFAEAKRNFREVAEALTPEFKQISYKEEGTLFGRCPKGSPWTAEPVPCGFVTATYATSEDDPEHLCALLKTYLAKTESRLEIVSRPGKCGDQTGRDIQGYKFRDKNSTVVIVFERNHESLDVFMISEVNR